jgi:hypothetical protein
MKTSSHRLAYLALSMGAHPHHQLHGALARKCKGVAVAGAEVTGMLLLILLRESAGESTAK